jgi:hypothetical protein
MEPKPALDMSPQRHHPPSSRSVGPTSITTSANRGRNASSTRSSGTTTRDGGPGGGLVVGGMVHRLPQDLLQHFGGPLGMAQRRGANPASGPDRFPRPRRNGPRILGVDAGLGPHRAGSLAIDGQVRPVHTRHPCVAQQLIRHLRHPTPSRRFSSRRSEISSSTSPRSEGTWAKRAFRRRWIQCVLQPGKSAFHHRSSHL